MGASLYDTDILAWSAAQAERLRRLAAGERVNDVDWENLIEEVEDLGLSEVRRLEALLRQALLHSLKILCYPGHAAIPHWRHELAVFLDQIRDRFQPALARRIDVDAVYRKATRSLLRDPLEGAAPLVPPGPIALTMTILLSEDFSRDELIARVASGWAADAQA